MGWTMRLLLLLLAALIAGQAHAVTLNATKIGGVHIAGTQNKILALAEVAGGMATKWTPQIALGSMIFRALMQDHEGHQVALVPNINCGVLGDSWLPEGWTNCNTPPDPAPTGAVYVCAGFQSSTAEGACQQRADAYLAATGREGSHETVGLLCNVYTEPGHVMQLSTGISVQCPSGYSNVNGVCSLSTPANVKWPSDGIPTYYPGAISPYPWTSHPRDPDNAGNIWNGMGFPSKTRTGYDPVGNPMDETPGTTTTGPDQKIKQREQFRTPDGQPAVLENSYTLDLNGYVTEVLSQIFYNSTLTVVNTSAPPPVDLHKDSTPMPTIPGARSFQESTELVMNRLKLIMPSFTLTGTAQCPVFTSEIPYLNFTLTIDQHCTWEPTIKPILSAAFTVAWSIMAAILLMKA